MNVSIIIASYNRGPLVYGAIRSALDLVNPLGWNISVVVIDDGSRDRTFESLLSQTELSLAEVLQDEPALQLARSDKYQLAVLRAPNGERGAARNRAALWADRNFAPEWFLFLDSDDRLTEDSMVRFAQELERSKDGKPNLLYSWYALWDGVHSPTRSKQNLEVLPSGDLAELSLEKTFIALGTSLVLRDAFFSVGMFPESRELSGSEDKILLTRVAFLGRSIFCRHVSVWYRQHGDNTEPKRMIRSIDLTENALTQDIKNRFGEHAGKMLARLKRHSYFKRLGNAIDIRNTPLATRLFFEGIRMQAGVLLDLDFWRLMASYIYSFSKKSKRI